MWSSILGMGASCFATCTDGKTVLKGYEVWEDGKLRASYPRRCEDALAHEAHVYEHLGPHPQILTCFGLEEVHLGVHSLRLELAPLGNVRQYMDGHRESSPATELRLQMALDVARGISHIHSRGVQHADLSCRNFFLFDGFRVKIGDFGASVIDGDDAFTKSPVCEEARYELPCRGRDFDDRPVRKRELFALGSAIYEIMAWHRPYEGLEDTEVEMRFAHEEFPPLGDITVGGVISNCWMEAYNSADEVALDLFETWKHATGGSYYTTDIETASFALVQTTISLCDTIKQYKGRDRTLNKLLEELQDFIVILRNLEHVGSALDTLMLRLLQGIICWCDKMCSEFETAMRNFSSKPKTGLRDWAKMEFMRGDINAFIDTLAAYMSTISIALGTATMNDSHFSHKVLEEYDEMIKDTIYDLEVRLQRLNDELSHLGAGEVERDSSEAQRMTYQVLNESRDNIAEIIDRLQERLNSIDLDERRARLQEDINVQKLCLELCTQASNQVSRRKTLPFNEIVSHGDSDQIMVTTLLDVFDAKKISAKQSSTQLVGSMSNRSLTEISRDSFRSRYGAGHTLKAAAMSHAHSEGPPSYSPASIQTTDRPSSNTARIREYYADNNKKRTADQRET